MTILEDKGQKEGKHTLKNTIWRKNGIGVYRVPLPVGDYIISNPKVVDLFNRKIQRGVDIKKMDLIGTYDNCVDTKEDMQEIVGNVCGAQHDRFRDECILAQNNGINLVVLIENEDGIESIDDVSSWHNPRLDIMVNSSTVIGTWKNGRPKYKKVKKYPKAPTGITLQKAMKTMQKKYGVTFMFCTPKESAGVVVELLKA